MIERLRRRIDGDGLESHTDPTRRERSVIDSPFLQPAALMSNLRLICAQPSVSGDARGLRDGAEAVLSILGAAGLDCSMIATAGAPIVVGRYDAGATRALLLYARYDVAASGPRRDWQSDPFVPAVRNDGLYARGAIIKGELVARAAAIGALIAQRIPLNVVFVVEGESLVGSPNLAAARESVSACRIALWSGGSYDSHDVPLLYTGLKGLLQVELLATGPTIRVPEAYAATVPNPLWTLTHALARLKSEYEEILIDGFYDHVHSPTHATLDAVRGLDVGETARRQAWGTERFIAGASGPMLARAELLAPTINISAIRVTGADGPAIPSAASAELHLQLVPDLDPDRAWNLLQAHLESRKLPGLTLRRLPGGYPPYLHDGSAGNAGRAATQIYGGEARVLPLAPFSAPAALLLDTAALISCGLERPSSAVFAPNEHLPMRDLVSHARFVTEVVSRLAV